MTSDVEIAINRSFLSRVPEIMERGGFTLQQAIEQARREDDDLCVELYHGHSERSQLAVHAMSDYVYRRLQPQTPKEQGQQ